MKVNTFLVKSEMEKSEEPRKRDVSDVDRKDRKKENRGDHTQE